MKELSIFIDESGDFGPYDQKSPYYIVAMVFHDQRNQISSLVSRLDRELTFLNFEDSCIHTGPLIRNEGYYSRLTLKERRSVFNKLVAFVRQADIQFKCLYIDKKDVSDIVDHSGRLSRVISQFIQDHYDYFRSFDTVKIYYDNGQTELTRVLSSVFNALLSEVKFKRVLPKDYKLFQVADMVCSLTLVDLKIKADAFSRSESIFFGNKSGFRKNYFKPIMKKEIK